MTVSLSRVREFFQNRTVRIVLVCILALILLLVSYKVFVKPDSSTYTPTSQEARLSELLEKVEGVEDVSVMITEEDGAAIGAVVLFTGKDGFLLRSKLLEITCTALNLQKNAVSIYPVN